MNTPPKSPRYTKKLHGDLQWNAVRGNGFQLKPRECLAIVATIDHLRAELADALGLTEDTD